MTRPLVVVLTGLVVLVSLQAPLVGAVGPFSDGLSTGTDPGDETSGTGRDAPGPGEPDPGDDEPGFGDDGDRPMASCDLTAEANTTGSGRHRTDGPVTDAPWFGGTTVYPNLNVEVTLNPSGVDQNRSITVALLSEYGTVYDKQTVTLSPGSNASSRTIGLVKTGLEPPDYVEVRVDGDIVETAIAEWVESRPAIEAVDLSVAERSPGVTGNASVTINRSQLTETLTLPVTVLNGSSRRATLSSGRYRIEPLGANESTDQATVTKRLSFEGTDVDRAFLRINGTVADSWHDPTPDSDPVRKDPPGQPIPEVGNLNWSTRTNGLSAETIALLFTRDDESNYRTQSAFRSKYGKNRTALMQAADGSDHPFARPPSAAQTWTRNDFEDLEAGDDNQSIVPTGAETSEGAYIKDAHATIFAVQPGTVLHKSKRSIQRYINPKGSLTGLVDYRVEAPNGTIPTNATEGDTRRLWCVAESSVEVRFLTDDTVRNTTTDQTPRFNYSLDGDGMGERVLALEATINATVLNRIDTYVCSNESNGTDPNATGGESTVGVTERPGTIGRPGSGGNESNESTRKMCTWNAGSTTSHTGELTVEDEISAMVYRFRAKVTNTTYPSGAEGAAVYSGGPWHAVQITHNVSDRVRGVWRYYTAYRSGWGTISKRPNEGDPEYVHSPALPVVVHAYPSRVGPVAPDPTITILDTWGEQRDSPQRLGKHIELRPEQPQYNATWGMAVRAPTVERENVTVYGVVPNTTATITVPASGRNEPIRTANLSVAIVATNDSAAVVEVTLQDNETGKPIALGKPSIDDPFRMTGGDPREGYLLVADQRVQTNATGEVRVVIRRPGQVTARYVPESWVSSDPAYASASASVRWLPQANLWYWVDLAVELFLFAIPFALVWYAAREFSNLFAYERL